MSEITIPHPDNPQHIDNLVTIPLLEAQGFSGGDASLQISLFEYGIIWRKLSTDKPGTRPLWLFVFNAGNSRDYPEHAAFAREVMEESDLERTFNWIKPAQWESLYDTHGGTTKEEWMSLPFPDRIADLYSYFGTENIFGANSEFEVRDPDYDYGDRPMPGESADDYYGRLLYGDSETGEPLIPTDFIRTPTGAWFTSPDFGSWLCHWHNGMDRIYAAGSSVIANREVPLEVIEDASALLRRRAQEAESSGRVHDANEASALAEVMAAALKATPSEEPQMYEE